MEIAHQDLKPSNVLVYGPAAGSKICDLGRAWDQNHAGPHDHFAIAGDTGYAPIDVLYGETPVDGRARRFGCDLYHLGSLIVFLFARVHINALIEDYLDPDHRAFRWGGTYSEVLPFVQAAFDHSLVRFSAEVPVFLADSWSDLFRSFATRTLHGAAIRRAPHQIAIRSSGIFLGLISWHTKRGCESFKEFNKWRR